MLHICLSKLSTKLPLYVALAFAAAVVSGTALASQSDTRALVEQELLSRSGALPQQGLIKTRLQKVYDWYLNRTSEYILSDKALPATQVFVPTPINEGYLIHEAGQRVGLVSGAKYQQGSYVAIVSPTSRLQENWQGTVELDNESEYLSVQFADRANVHIIDAITHYQDINELTLQDFSPGSPIDLNADTSKSSTEAPPQKPALPKGQLFINPVPSSAQVEFIDSNETYVRGEGIPYGTYLVRVSKDGFYPHEQRVLLRKPKQIVIVQLVAR
ncbi:hypothetical protein [Aliagarivorans taiwanensis]|uniref:hypothetical protein n=1 Tax=Aliagarivorans taiwanensis TaxID=561966 RepID=UPI00040EEB3A|nr:hypothetical protein [Aliagarivorans taiwanensis]